MLGVCSRLMYVIQTTTIMQVYDITNNETSARNGWTCSQKLDLNSKRWTRIGE